MSNIPSETEISVYKLDKSAINVNKNINIVDQLVKDIAMFDESKADKADTYTKSEIDSTVKKIYSDTGYKDGYEDAIDTYVTPGQLYRIIGPKTPSDGVIIVPSDFEPYFIFATSNFVLSVGAGDLYYTQYRINGKSVSRRMYTLRPNDEGFAVIGWTEWESVVWKNEADAALALKADKAKTLSGYGIEDACIKGSISSDGDLFADLDEGIYAAFIGAQHIPNNMPIGGGLIVFPSTTLYDYEHSTRVFVVEDVVGVKYGAGMMYIANLSRPVGATEWDTSSMVWHDVSYTSDIESLLEQMPTKADKATTLSGYGITDAYTKAEADVELERIEAVAKGRATGYVFDTVDDMNTWLADAENTAQLVLGDNLYIRALDVPDYWWDGAQAQQLETQKVDLSEYVKTTELAAKEDKTTFVTSEDTSALVTMLNNTETRLGTVTELEIILPETIPEDYISSVVFTSGETAAVFIQPMYLYLSGEGCTNGVFTPAVNMRYTIVLSYDGVSVSGIVGGVPLT